MMSWWILARSVSVLVLGLGADGPASRFSLTRFYAGRRVTAPREVPRVCGPSTRKIVMVGIFREGVFHSSPRTLDPKLSTLKQADCMYLILSGTVAYDKGAAKVRVCIMDRC